MKNNKILTTVLIAVALHLFGALVLGLDPFAIVYGFIYATFIWSYLYNALRI